MNESPYQVLDARQIKRIEAVHGGFLYQHLYAVGCLFLAAKAGASAVVVERDEDIEIETGAQRVYVQVKTRSAPIMPSDIDDVLRRFSQLRMEHVEGRREGGARFVIIVNSAPSPALGAKIQSNGIPGDVSIQWPGHTIANAPAVLPPAWSGVPEAVQWCIAAAETLPFALLSPSSGSWRAVCCSLPAVGGQTPITRFAWKVFQSCSSNC